MPARRKNEGFCILFTVLSCVSIATFCYIQIYFLHSGVQLVEKCETISSSMPRSFKREVKLKQSLLVEYSNENSSLATEFVSSLVAALTGTLIARHVHKVHM